MTATNKQVEFLATRCAEMTDAQVRGLHASAMAASAVHQAGGRFYMAELCEDRAKDLLEVLAQRVESV